MPLRGTATFECYVLHLFHLALEPNFRSKRRINADGYGYSRMHNLIAIFNPRLSAFFLRPSVANLSINGKRRVDLLRPSVDTPNEVLDLLEAHVFQEVHRSPAPRSGRAVNDDFFG